MRWYQSPRRLSAPLPPTPLGNLASAAVKSWSGFRLAEPISFSIKYGPAWSFIVATFVKATEGARIVVHRFVDRRIAAGSHGITFRRSGTAVRRFWFRSFNNRRGFVCHLWYTCKTRFPNNFVFLQFFLSVSVRGILRCSTLRMIVCRSEISGGLFVPIRTTARSFGAYF